MNASPTNEPRDTQVRIDSKRRAVLVGMAVFLSVWLIVLVALAATVLSADPYLITYWGVDYTFGFVRRGLAGELADLGPDFFTSALTLRWLSSGAYVAALACLSWSVWSGRRTERSAVLAATIPVLPAGVAFAVLAGRPDLFGAATLIGLCVALAAVKSDRAVVASCIAYGLAIGVLAFLHEAIPMFFSLGAILAVLIIPNGLTDRTKRWCLLTTVVPGLAAMAVLALFTRRDVAARFCEIAPSRPIPKPPTSLPAVLEYLRTRHLSTMDYRDWACSYPLRIYDYSIRDAMREVFGLGAVNLTVSLATGLLALGITVVVLRRLSGVTFSSVAAVPLRGHLWWPLFGLAMLAPVFLTGIDWTRWVVIIALDVGMVFLMAVRRRPELDRPFSQSGFTASILSVVLLALFPIGAIPGGHAQ